MFSVYRACCSKTRIAASKLLQNPHNGLMSYAYQGLPTSSKFNIHSSCHQDNDRIPFNEIGGKVVPQKVELFDPEKEFFEDLNTDAKTESPVVEYNEQELPISADSFAAYANVSEVLQTLIMFGVELHKIEKHNPTAMQFYVKLDLLKDITPKLEYLTTNGILPAEFGQVITKNPFLLDPNKTIGDLEETTGYLKSKNFTQDQVSLLFVRFPQMWNMSVVKLDGMLGFYQNLPTNYETKTISFTGDQLRNMVLKCPSIVALPTESVYLMIKSMEMSCGFTIQQIRQIIAAKPSMLFRGRNNLNSIYLFCSNEMKLTHEEIARNPFLFDTRLERLVTRHRYLNELGKDIYKDTEPGYISLFDVICSTNEEFCRNCDIGTIAEFEKYMRTQ
ncbi:transcription termination factor 3, mitochondrial-like [Ciona intestinalis]